MLYRIVTIRKLNSLYSLVSNRFFSCLICLYNIFNFCCCKTVQIHTKSQEIERKRERWRLPSISFPSNFAFADDTHDKCNWVDKQINKRFPNGHWLNWTSVQLWHTSISNSLSQHSGFSVYWTTCTFFSTSIWCTRLMPFFFGHSFLPNCCCLYHFSWEMF